MTKNKTKYDVETVAKCLTDTATDEAGATAFRTFRNEDVEISNDYHIPFHAICAVKVKTTTEQIEVDDPTCQSDEPPTPGEPHIDGADNTSMKQGTDFDLTDGVTAYDADGNEIPFTVSPSEVDKCEVGEQTFTYTAEGVTKERVITVEQIANPTISGIENQITVDVDETFDALEGVTAVDGNGNVIAVTTDAPTSYDTAGEYTISYTATDKCDNQTVETRKVVVVGLSTVLFADGTLIINEISTDRESNIAQYGAVVKEYAPLDANNPYVFNSGNDQPWLSERQRISSVEFGSVVAPTSTAYWFQNAENLADIDFTNFDGSSVTSIRAFLAKTAVTSVTLPAMPNLENMQYAFNKCVNLSSIDLSNVGANGVTNMQDTFQGCYALTEISLVGLGGMVDKADRTFANYTNEGDMSLTTIYSDGALKFWQASSSTAMFRGCTHLVGGQGTPFDSSVINKDWARIDNPPDEKGYFTQA